MILGSYGARPWQYPAFDTNELRPKSTRYCVCVFVLNEKERLPKQLAKMQGLPCDVIIADGGSTDGTNDPEMLRALNVRTLLIKRGPGKLGAQMRMAFAYALTQGYEGVIVVDGNDKDDVTAGVPRFIDRLDRGDDHVQGSRYIPGGEHENTPMLRHLGVTLYHAPLISWAAGFHYTDTTNGFRAYSRRLLEDPEIRIMRDELQGYDLHYVLAIEAAQRGYKVSEVPVTRRYPKGEVPTKITGVKGNLRLLWTLTKTALKTTKKI